MLRYLSVVLMVSLSLYVDAHEAGGAVQSALPKQSAWLLGCSETQSTSGQTDDPKVPHGFLVLALCEALHC